MDISYQYAKLRCNYGRQPMFCERGPEMCDTIATDKAEFKQYILRNPVHQLTQHTPVFWQHKVNTIRTEYASTGANHAEGGWPKDVLVTDPEATQRYRRKVEKDDNYIHCITSAAPGMDHYVSQNNAIDMYRTYYVEMPSMPDVERSSCRLVNVYRDVAGGRPVSSVCWQPDGQRYAVTYVDMDWNRLPRAALECYLWDVDNMNYPEVTLTPPCPLLDLQFNQRHPEMLAGALMSGQVGVWDRRAGGLARLVSAAHAAHRDLVRNVLFINAKSGQELFSAGPDGAVKWWDVRNMSEPTDEMILDAVKSSFDVPSMPKANGASVLEFEPTVPSRFFVGTENGRVLSGNRKGKTPMEKLPLQFEAHLGPVWSVERNPNFLKNFLTVGDWTARVWSEDCRDSSIIMSPPGRHKITHGTWSPTRMSLMVLTQWNGVLAVWDLLRRQHEPTLAVQVCQEPLMTVRMHESGTLAACGSRRGNVYMVELSANLARSYRSDKGILTAVLERESKRERILEARLRELRLRRTQPEERSPRGSARDVAAGADRDLTDAAAAYVQHARRELAAM